MKSWLRLSSLCLLCLLFTALPVKGEEKSAVKHLQLTIGPGAQLCRPETSIKGFRFTLFYGKNRDMSGLDIGSVNTVTGRLKGVQLGAANFVDNDMTGWQVGLLNRVKENTRGIQAGCYNQSRETKGIQIGLANSSKTTRGIQIGLINHSDSMTGVQIGLFYNTVDTLKGLQIGLFNFTWKRKPIFFFPLVNFSF